jgi:hypothetical protein
VDGEDAVILDRYGKEMTGRLGHGGAFRAAGDIPLCVLSRNEVSRLLASPRVVVLGVVASQVLLIGGLLAWGIWLGVSATGSLPPVQAARITVWVSDPRWHVAPTLTVSQQTWTVGLTSSKDDSGVGTVDPGAEAIVVLWGAARLGDPHPEFGPLSSAAPGSFEQVQVPRSQAQTYMGGLFPGQAVPVQVFAVTAREYFKTGFQTGSIIPVRGATPSGLYAKTSTGWAAFVPTIEMAGIAFGDSCRTTTNYVPAAILDVLSGGKRLWYGMTCPAPASRVQLMLGENQSLASSTLPQSSQVPTNGDPVWSSSAGASALLGYLTGFWIDVSDPAIAAAAQRELLYSGVLFGVAGGLVAAWLIAGVTFVVSRAAKAARHSGAPAGTSERTNHPADAPDGGGIASRRPQAEVEQVPPGRAGGLEQQGERLELDQGHHRRQPSRYAAEAGNKDAGDHSDRQEPGTGGRSRQLGAGEDRAGREAEHRGANDTDVDPPGPKLCDPADANVGSDLGKRSVRHAGVLAACRHPARHRAAR